jgi:hypothetical protein
VKIPPTDIPGVTNSSISNISNQPPVQDNYVVSGNAPPPPGRGNASSATPRTISQSQPPQRTTQGQPPPTRSGTDLLERALKQESDKSYLKESMLCPGTNLYDTVNEEINKKTTETSMEKLGEQKKKKKKNDRKKKMQRITGVIDNNPVKIEESDSEDSTYYELESNEEDQMIRDIVNKNKIVEEDEDRSDMMKQAN